MGMLVLQCKAVLSACWGRLWPRVAVQNRPLASRWNLISVSKWNNINSWFLRTPCPASWAGWPGQWRVWWPRWRWGRTRSAKRRKSCTLMSRVEHVCFFKNKKSYFLNIFLWGQPLFGSYVMWSGQYIVAYVCLQPCIWSVVVCAVGSYLHSMPFPRTENWEMMFFVTTYK